MARREFYDITKETVTLDMAVRQYLPGETIKAGRISCPLHHGHDKNMALYRDHFYCYVCNQGGDVIGCVSHILGISAHDALVRMNEDFRLGLPVDYNSSWKGRRDYAKKHEAETKARWQRQQTAIAKDLFRREVLKAYYIAERRSRELAPQDPEDEPSEEWLQACFWLNILEEWRWEFA